MGNGNTFSYVVHDRNSTFYNAHFTGAESLKPEAVDMTFDTRLASGPRTDLLSFSLA